MAFFLPEDFSQPRAESQVVRFGDIHAGVSPRMCDQTQARQELSLALSYQGFFLRSRQASLDSYCAASVVMNLKLAQRGGH